MSTSPSGSRRGRFLAGAGFLRRPGHGRVRLRQRHDRPDRHPALPGEVATCQRANFSIAASVVIPMGCGVASGSTSENLQVSQGSGALWLACKIVLGHTAWSLTSEFSFGREFLRVNMLVRGVGVQVPQGYAR